MDVFPHKYMKKVVHPSDTNPRLCVRPSVGFSVCRHEEMLYFFNGKSFYIHASNFWVTYTLKTSGSGLDPEKRLLWGFVLAGVVTRFFRNGRLG